MSERSKLTSSHLRRQAFVYLRQSSQAQLERNVESTARQYALVERATELGFAREQVVVVDEDLGISGSGLSERSGFARLTAEVALGHAGLVLGLEVSRLARNNADWYRLLDLCGVTDTVIGDADGLYHPGSFNDRLLLGLKGTMSEAELHVLKARLIGGQLAKARRGELEVPLPVGLVYDGAGRVVLDADVAVQSAIRQFFETFTRTGSATGTVRAFRELGLLFPRRVQSGSHRGELVWGPLLHYRALNVLKNPRYAGAFAYGRTRAKKAGQPSGLRQRLPRDQWHTLILDAHPGYITWAEYEGNLARLRANSAAYGHNRRHGPPREGPALLQGLAVCGRCGGRMTIRYYTRRGQLLPEYACQSEGIKRAEGSCQRVLGADVDRAIGDLLVETMTPLTLEVALSVQDELASRADEADRLRRQQVERARYEAELAQRRYLRVDPDNRLVAVTLEAEWNNKLRALDAAQEDYDRQREADVLLDDEKRGRILALATDFPRLWRDPQTPARERKRMARLLVEDVTLMRVEDVLDVHVRFRGGDTRSLQLPRPKPIADLRKLDPAIVVEVDRLLDDHTDSEIAEALNAAGHQPPVGDSFTIWIVWKIRKAHGLESRFDRLRRQGMLTLEETAQALGVHHQTVKDRANRGQLTSIAYNDKGQRLYAPPRPVTMIPCTHCGKPVPERAGQGQRRKYCCVSCRTGAYAARRRAAGWVRVRRSP